MGRKKRTRIRNVYDLFVCGQETYCVSGSSTQLELGWSCAFSHVITDDDVLFLGKTTLFHITLWKEVVLRQVQTSFLVSVLGLFCVGVCVCACCPLPLFFKLYKISAKKSTRHISCCRKKIQEFVQSGSVLTLFCILCKKDPIKKENC